jgi:hypothetical protein
MTLIREALVMRREMLVQLLWYRCPDCQDVGFSTRPMAAGSDSEISAITSSRAVNTTG